FRRRRSLSGGSPAVLAGVVPPARYSSPALYRSSAVGLANRAHGSGLGIPLVFAHRAARLSCSGAATGGLVLGLSSCRDGTAHFCLPVFLQHAAIDLVLRPSAENQCAYADLRV